MSPTVSRPPEGTGSTSATPVADTAAPGPEVVAASRPRTVFGWRPSTGGFGAVWVVTALLFVASAVFLPGTVAPTALLSMLPFAAILAVAASGQTLVAQQGGLDLSAAGVISLSAVTVVQVSGGSDGRIVVALLAALAAGLVSGLVSGLAITRFGITPFVATLGVNALAQGTILAVTGGNMSNSVPPGLTSVVTTDVLGVPALIWLCVVVVVALALLTRRTVIGRQLEASGANTAAAIAVGLPVARLRVGAYVTAAGLYAVAGILLGAFIARPSAFQGDPYLLTTIAAVAVGGTAFGGGRGSVVATAGGALFLTQLGQVVLASGLPTASQNLVQGAVIALGVALGGGRAIALVRRLRPTTSTPTR
ncbi:MAG: ABC transporter permease [Nocardioidaceae bacterium]|nr:ABC transporter permease [Nocardioidaceae bacterium]